MVKLRGAASPMAPSRRLSAQRGPCDRGFLLCRARVIGTTGIMPRAASPGTALPPPRSPVGARTTPLRTTVRTRVRAVGRRVVDHQHPGTAVETARMHGPRDRPGEIARIDNAHLHAR